MNTSELFNLKGKLVFFKLYGIGIEKAKTAILAQHDAKIPLENFKFDDA